MTKPFAEQPRAQHAGPPTTWPDGRFVGESVFDEAFGVWFWREQGWVQVSGMEPCMHCGKHPYLDWSEP